MNFDDALNVTVGEVERPPLLPVGVYRWKVQKFERNSVGENDMYDVLNFNVICTGAEAVDEDELADYPGQVNGTPNRVGFMFDTTDEVKFQQTLFRLQGFIKDHLGIAESEGRPMKEALSMSIGHEFLGTIGHRPDKNDPENKFAEIRKTAAVE